MNGQDAHRILLDNNKWLKNEKYNFYWNTLNSIRYDSFDAYNHQFMAIKKASCMAHYLATEVTDKFMRENKRADSNEKNKVKENDEKIEFEISDDLLEFYEKSLNFKKNKKINEMKRLKQMKEEGISDDHKSAEQLSFNTVESTKNAPYENIDDKRNEDLERLFGKSADKIHLLETRMQMKFDKDFDLYQPVYWPSFPLRLNFK